MLCSPSFSLLWALLGPSVAWLPPSLKELRRQEKHFDAFRAWINSQGGFLSDKVKLKYLTKQGLSVRGLVASEQLGRNETIMQIPESLIMNIDRFPALQHMDFTQECTMLAAGKATNTKLMLALALEMKKQKKSSFWHWIRLQPTAAEFLSNSTTWLAADFVINEFASLPLMEFLKMTQNNMIAALRACMESLPKSHGLRALTGDDILGARALMQSRFHVDSAGELYSPMGIEFLNAGLEPDGLVNATFDTNSDMLASKSPVRVNSSVGMAPGTELLYNHIEGSGNHQLVFSSGFYLEGNPYDDGEFLKLAGISARSTKSEGRDLFTTVMDKLELTGSSVRCKDSLAREPQPMVRCNLARLVYESHGEVWRKKGWIKNKGDGKARTTAKSDL